MGKKRKIVFFIGSLDRGGTETYILRFLKFLNNQHQVTIVVKGATDGPIKTSLEEAGALVVPKHIGYFNLRKWRELLKWLQKEEFDVVCDFNGNFAAIPMVLSYRAGIQIRIALYRNSSYRFKPSFLKLMYFKALNSLVYKYATKILSNSKFALSFFFNSYSPYDNKFKVIPNGVDSNLFNTLSQRESRGLFQLPYSSIIIGHVGRFNPSKNHQTIAEVADRLCRNNSNIIFVLCGKDTDSEECKSLFKTLPENRIKFLGNVNNIEKIYPAFDLFYFPSVTEGQPNALIEAMLSGLPVVASNIEAIQECFPIGKINQLVNPTDAEVAVGVINQCLQNKVVANEYIHRDFAINEYDAKYRFEEFEFEILT